MKPKFKINTEGNVVFTDGEIGGILLSDERWYPFCRMNNGDYDIWDCCGDGGSLSPSSAFDIARVKYTNRKKKEYE